MIASIDVIRARLTDKYARLIALRLAHARGEPPDIVEIRALARAYPGALMELDRVPLAELEARLAALRDGELPAWAEVAFGYHALMIIALAVRRAAGRDRDAARALAALEPTIGTCGLTPSHLKSLMNPPEGRLSMWAASHLAAYLELPLDEVRRRLFGHLGGHW